MNEKEIIDKIVELRKDGLKAAMSGDLVKSKMCDEQIKRLQVIYWSSKEKKK